jgi:hypothetical protein
VEVTYPNVTMLPDGNPLIALRTGAGSHQSGRGDWYLYRYNEGWQIPVHLFKGINLPLGEGMGVGSPSTVDDESNSSAYPSRIVVEPAWGKHPGRLHMTWCWRRDGAVGLGIFSNYGWAYGYSDDNGHSWRTITKRPIVLPITPHNNPDSLIFPTWDERSQPGYGWVNGSALTLDPNGYPHIMCSTPTNHIYWDGNGWNATEYGTIFGWDVGGYSVLNRPAPFWFDGEIWALAVCSLGDDAAAGRIFKLDGSEGYQIGGHVDDDPAFQFPFDAEAWRLYREIKVLIPDGSNPRTFTFYPYSKSVA